MRTSNQLPEVGRCVTLASVVVPRPSLLGRKVRVAGQMVSYDPFTALILIQDGDAALLADVSLCVHPTSFWVRDTGAVVVVVGDLERADEPLQIPTLPLHEPSPTRIDAHIVVRALVVVPTHDLELPSWHQMVEDLKTHRNYTREGGEIE